MPGSFRNIIRVSDTSTFEPLTNQTLSIGLFPDGFVFAVLDDDHYRYIALEEYAIPLKNAFLQPDVFLQLESFIRTHPILKTGFQKVHCAYYSPQLILIPEAVYDENRIKDYFTFCASLPGNHKLFSDRMNILNARGIYAVPENLSHFFEKMFPGYHLKHHGTVLAESALAGQKLEPWQADAVIHVRNSHFEILLIDKQQLIYYQSFSYQAFDDVLYYLFYTLEQHKLDATKMSVLLMGKLAMDTAEYDTLVNFFRKITFPERNDVFQYSEAFERIPSHFYYNLLNLVTCG